MLKHSSLPPSRRLALLAPPLWLSSREGLALRGGVVVLLASRLAGSCEGHQRGALVLLCPQCWSAFV